MAGDCHLLAPSWTVPNGWGPGTLPAVAVHISCTRTFRRQVKVRRMPVWTILLRLLLAVALTFNGVATAAASAHLGHMGAVETPAAAKASAAEDPPCHEHHQATAAVDEQPVPAPQSKGHPSPDCCKSAACRCACVHHAPAAIAALSFGAPIIEHEDSVRSMSSGHAAPALPHLIRPPIG